MSAPAVTGGRAGPGRRPGRRAPRLGPGERLAPHITRHGRFRKIDPRRGRPLPSVVAFLGTLGWGLLVAESFRRAVAAARATGPEGEQ